MNFFKFVDSKDQSTMIEWLPRNWRTIQRETRPHRLKIFCLQLKTFEKRFSSYVVLDRWRKRCPAPSEQHTSSIFKTLLPIGSSRLPIKNGLIPANRWVKIASKKCAVQRLHQSVWGRFLKETPGLRKLNLIAVSTSDLRAFKWQQYSLLNLCTLV